MELVVCILRVFSRKIEINNGADLCLSADIGIDAVKKIDDVLPLLRRRFGRPVPAGYHFPDIGCGEAPLTAYSPAAQYPRAQIVLDSPCSERGHFCDLLDCI